MAVLNMTKTCKKSGITSFSRTRGGWMKRIEGLDKQHSNGYSFVGSNFIKVGNFNTNIMNGLYLDQSTSIIDNRKVFTMNLFKIIDGEVELLKTTPKTNGWAMEFWDEVENYFKSESINAQEIVNMIHELTNNPELINEVIDILKFNPREESPYTFRNWHEVKSYLSYMKCYTTPVKMLTKILEDENNPYYPEFIFKHDAIPYKFRKLMCAEMKILNTPITEETFIDCKQIQPTVIKHETFQEMIELYEPFYLVKSLPNNTGYHNKVGVWIYYMDDDTFIIRHFNYFVDPKYMWDQIPKDYGGTQV